MWRTTLAVIVFCLSPFFTETQAWGIEGHKVVADIAYSRLTPTAQRVVDYYLGGVTLPAAAPFPDDYDHTTQGRWSQKLHYVNVPRDATEYTNAYCDPEGCAVSAILNYTKQLAVEGPSGPVCSFDHGDLPCPLVFVTHLVGDLHQPLHVGYGDDEGGNTVQIDFLGKKGNLHQVWDRFIIEKYKPDWKSFSQELQSYMEQNPKVVAQYETVTDIAKWSNESFQYVRNDVYKFDPNGLNVKATYLGERYYSNNLPIVQQRLIAAGVRLGALINTVFSSNKKISRVWINTTR